MKPILSLSIWNSPFVTAPKVQLPDANGVTHPSLLPLKTELQMSVTVLTLVSTGCTMLLELGERGPKQC